MRSAIGLAMTAAMVASACSAVPNLDAGGMGCNNLPDRSSQIPVNAVVDQGGGIAPDAPMLPRGPLAGIDVKTHSAGEVGRMAADHGFLVTYRFEYPTEASGVSGYAECWCVPPPGVVSDATYGSHGEVILFVRGPMIPGGRP